MRAVFRSAIRLLLLVATFALAAAPARADKVLTEEVFTRVFAGTLAAIAPDLVAERVGPLQVTTRDDAGKQRQIFLENAYRNYVAQPDRLHEILTAYQERALAPRTDSAGIDPDSIVPVLQRPVFFDTLRASVARGGDDSGWEPAAHDSYNAELTIFYVMDDEREPHYLTEADLAASGLSPADRRARAVENLRKRLPGVQVRGERGMHIVNADGYYASSLLLVDSFWQSGRFPVQGETVVSVATREMLIVTGSENATVVEDLRRLAADTRPTAGYPLTDRLFVFRNGKFVPFGS